MADRRLAENPYLAGAAYSIADMAAYPWFAALITPLRGIAGDALPQTPAFDRWLADVGARPAVQRARAAIWRAFPALRCSRPKQAAPLRCSEKPAR